MRRGGRGYGFVTSLDCETTPKGVLRNSLQKECLKPIVVVVVLPALCRALRRQEAGSGNLTPSKITPMGVVRTRQRMGVAFQSTAPASWGCLAPFRWGFLSKPWLPLLASQQGTPFFKGST